MYEILHEKAPEKELAFYLSYAEKGQRILEPMCGSGRFLIPFSEKGFDISGMDRSGEMLERCRQKLPGAKLGASASITKNSAEMLRCRASSFALAIIAGVRSMPTTSCPSGESKKVKKPVPAPTSSTRNGLLSADSGSFGTISSSQRLAFGLSSSRKR